MNFKDLAFVLSNLGYYLADVNKDNSVSIGDATLIGGLSTEN